MKCKSFLSSSVGQKFLVALTGLGLSGFVLTHMLGNLLLFVGPNAYNLYGHKLTSTPLIYVAEVVLVTLFVVHVGLTLKLQKANRASRPIAPSQLPNVCVKRASFASRTMALSGLMILSFAILHLVTFKFGPYYAVTVDGVEMRDLYKLVQESFQKEWYTGFYLVCMVILFTHLSHGFTAAFQSLGLSNTHNTWLKRIGFVFALVVAGGFFSQPLYMYLAHH
ncbi:MAG: cytochrome B subunit [Proteobacteria bacterium]|nr:cytochrome B subunit [Pseudomonadota bacterium]NDC24578.1 cytochrome B subunit [Pseudomonadota bacterium]NDD04499.1 cytochrome B subunit [Pseudomonadota bacterium]